MTQLTGTRPTLNIDHTVPTGSPILGTNELRIHPEDWRIVRQWADSQPPPPCHP